MTDPVDIVPFNVGKIQALLERQIREGMGDGSNRTKNYLCKRKSDEVYSHYVQTEILTLHLYLHSSEGLFMDRVDSIVTKLDKYRGKGSGSVALFISNLDVNVYKLKGNFILRGGMGKKIFIIKYNEDLKRCKSLQNFLFRHRALVLQIYIPRCSSQAPAKNVSKRYL